MTSASLVSPEVAAIEHSTSYTKDSPFDDELESVILARSKKNPSLTNIICKNLMRYTWMKPDERMFVG